MTRSVVLALAACLAAASASAQHVYRSVGPDGRVTYSDQAPSTGAYTNVQPAGGSGPSTIPQSAAPIAPTQAAPTAMTPSTGAPSTIPSSAVPAPGSHQSTTGRVVPGTVGPNSADRQFGLSPDDQRIDRDAARRNIEQGERAREADAVRLNVEPGERARQARDMQTGVPQGEQRIEQQSQQIGIPADEARREREAVKLNQ